MLTKTLALRLACIAPLALGACAFHAEDFPSAPPTSGDAIALARARIGGAVHLVLVTGDDADALVGRRRRHADARDGRDAELDGSTARRRGSTRAGRCRRG